MPPALVLVLLVVVLPLPDASDRATALRLTGRAGAGLLLLLAVGAAALIVTDAWSCPAVVTAGMVPSGAVLALGAALDGSCGPSLAAATRHLRSSCKCAPVVLGASMGVCRALGGPVWPLSDTRPMPHLHLCAVAPRSSSDGMITEARVERLRWIDASVRGLRCTSI